MLRENPKSLLNAQFAALARVLGQEHRLELLEHLGQGERSVEVLASRTGLGFANVSQHLQHLRRAGLVTSRRAGKNNVYRLADGPVIETLTALRTLAAHSIAEVREVVFTHFTSLDAMEPISRNELVGRLKDGSVTLLDVRPEDEYRLGHLPGAVNLTIDTLEARLTELPRSLEIVAYCRGTYCMLSFKAVRLLRTRGYNVRRLEDGFPEWRAAGHSVERTDADVLG